MAHYLVDARGLQWPEPLFHLEEQIRHLSNLDTIELLATDPLVETELPPWCRDHGYYLVELTKEAEEIRACLELSE